jgi:hypothetical protein
MGSGKEFLVTLTSVSGRILRQMAMEYINGRMEIGTRESGQTVLSMDKVQTSLQMETHSQDSTNMESLMASVNTNGRMEVNT